ENIKIQLLGAIINDKVWELRHEKGYALYYINVYGGFNHDLQRYQISLKIDCEIDEFASIHKECGQIISDIRSGRISDELFQLNINRMRSLYSVNRINGNDQVQRRLYEYYRYHTAWLDSMEL